MKGSKFACSFAPGAECNCFQLEFLVVLILKWVFLFRAMIRIREDLMLNARLFRRKSCCQLQSIARNSKELQRNTWWLLRSDEIATGKRELRSQIDLQLESTIAAAKVGSNLYQPWQQDREIKFMGDAKQEASLEQTTVLSPSIADLEAKYLLQEYGSTWSSDCVCSETKQVEKDWTFYGLQMSTKDGGFICEAIRVVYS